MTTPDCLSIMSNKVDMYSANTYNELMSLAIPHPLHTYKHCEYQSFTKLHLNGLAQVLHPVYPLPPHCAH
jgi:hypothetical protein